MQLVQPWDPKTVFTSSAQGRALAPTSDAFSLAAKVKASAVDNSLENMLCFLQFPSTSAV